MRPSFWMTAVAALALIWSAAPPVRAKDLSAAELAKHDTEILAAIERGLERENPRPGLRKPAACQRTPGNPWPGLTINGGVVSKSDTVLEIGGFAKSAQTTGGLSGALKIVTTLADYAPGGKEPVVAGSLRAAVEELSNTKKPGWIVFAPELGLGAKITLKAPLRLPDNVTLDGRCADVTLEATAKIGLVYIFGKRNIIITNLAFQKSDYVAGQPDQDVESCVRLNGAFDAIAIVHNDLARCSDGVIDTTTSPKKPLPSAARVTVAYNFIRDHDKTMLFGTFGCVDDSEAFAQGCGAPKEGETAPLPVLYLTLEGNLFLRTGQRHPRVYGRVFAHIANNAIIFEQQKQGTAKDGKQRSGSGYGTFVSNGAQALIERNVYLALGRNEHPSAVWTTTSPGAERMLEDVEGAIRIADNLVSDREQMADHMPSTVPDPLYRGSWRSPALAGRSIEQAIACVATRAGRGGLAHWPQQQCGPL